MTESSQLHEKQNTMWTDLLEPVEKSLKALQTSTETQFMKIGENMGLFSQLASEISQDSLSVMELIAGKENLKMVDDILKKITGIERFISYSILQLEEDSKILGKQKENFLQFSNPLLNLKKIIIQLNTLSIAIKIENTRLISDSSEFSILADEVKTLAKNSKNNIEDIGKILGRRLSAA